MATTAPRNSSLSAAVEDAVRSNVHLRERVEVFVDRVMKHAEWTLKYGTPSEKSTLMRQVLVPMMKALSDAKGEEERREQKEAIERMYAALRGEP